MGADAGRPRYVAIITDGNGRWAKRHGVSVAAGHDAGADTVKARLRDAVELGVRELTVYSFSTENWSRPRERGRRADADVQPPDHDARRRSFARRACGCASSAAARASRPALARQMDWAEAQTADNDRITLFVAFNYGGRAEILDAARALRAAATRTTSARCSTRPRCTTPT